MCLGVPGRIVEIRDHVAVVDFWGMRREVRLELVDQPVAVGDYVLNHVGYAIRRIPEADIAGTLALYEELLREAGDDLMTADVRAEMEATPPSSEASPSRRAAPSPSSRAAASPSSAEGASPSRRAAPSPSSRAAASPSSAEGASPSSERSERAFP